MHELTVNHYNCSTNFPAAVHEGGASTVMTFFDMWAGQGS